MSKESYLPEDVIAASLCKQYIESAKEWQNKMAQSLECVPDNESELCERYIVYLSVRSLQSADHVWALHSLHPQFSYGIRPFPLNRLSNKLGRNKPWLKWIKMGVPGLVHRRSFGGSSPQISHPRFLELEEPRRF
jgi:hypothetical protein